MPSFLSNKWVIIAVAAVAGMYLYKNTKIFDKLPGLAPTA